MQAGRDIPGHVKDLWTLLPLLRAARWVDLTHAFDETIPHCTSFDPARRTILYHYNTGVGTKGHGFLAEEWCLPGQWGTHVDPPAHFVRGLRFQDEIPVTEMLLPLVVLDVSAQAARDADYCVSLDDVRAWEERHGPVPEGGFVALRTGWSARWPSQERMLNRDAAGVCHFPGWSQEVLSYLYEERGITTSGHDTTDTDPGMVVSRGVAPLEAYVLGLDRWQVELMANLDQVPEQGALLVASWPKVKRGSGFPARVFAISPAHGAEAEPKRA